MTFVTALLGTYVVLSLAYWLVTLYGVLRVRRCVRPLDDLAAPDPEAWPVLSVIVPACNEADKIEPACRTLIAEDYPNLEIVLIDDRSSDATGEIIDRLAEQDDRVRAIHITELPDGWLGKANALNTGLAASGGQLVLFTDADVHFKKGTLRKAVAWCTARKLDHLAALPAIWPGTLATDAIVSVFLRSLMTLATPPWRAQDPDSKGFLGVGAFNMVCREAFETAGGFEYLRLEVADDMGTAMMMKHHGAAADVVAAFDNVGLHWYRTVAEAWRGAEKAFAMAGCRFTPTALVGIVSAGLEASPVVALLAALLCGWSAGGWVLSASVVAVFLAASVLLARWAHVRVAPAVLAPLVAPLSMAITLWAAAAGLWRGGVVWRGTLYPSAMLRQGRRLRLF